MGWKLNDPENLENRTDRERPPVSGQTVQAVNEILLPALNQVPEKSSCRFMDFPLRRTEGSKKTNSHIYGQDKKSKSAPETR